jgi:hypothetical protein
MPDWKVYGKMPIYIMLSVCDHENPVAVYSGTYRSSSELRAYFEPCGWVVVVRPFKVRPAGPEGRVVMKGQGWSRILEIDAEMRTHFISCCISIDGDDTRFAHGRTDADRLFEEESPLRSGIDDERVFTMTAPDFSLHSYGGHESRYCICMRSLPVKEWPNAVVVGFDTAGKES